MTKKAHCVNNALTKKLTYIIPKKNGEISSMNLFVICFISAVLLYVLTLPFIGKRAKKSTHRRSAKACVFKTFPMGRGSHRVQSQTRFAR